MIINREKLIKALVTVQPGLGTKESINEWMLNFIFTGKEIVTYNESVCITYPFETDFICLVKANELYKILIAMTIDSIDIECDENQFKINSKSISVGLHQKAIEKNIIDNIHQLSISEVKKWTVLPKDFIQGLSLCVFSTAKNIMEGAISCIHINNNTISSTDNYRISQFIMKDKMIGVNILLSLYSVLTLIKIPIIKYAVNDSWIQFKTEDGVIISIRRVQDTFPNINDFLIVKGISVDLPKELQSVLKLVKIIMDDFSNIIEQKIKLVLKTNKLICYGEGSNGWIKQDIPCVYSGEEISFLINPVFLNQILDKITFVVIGENHALFSSNNFKHVMLLPVKE